jgi:hypothetical protein
VDFDLAHVDQPIHECSQPEFVQIDFGGDEVRHGHQTSRHARYFETAFVGAITPYSGAPGKRLAGLNSGLPRERKWFWPERIELCLRADFKRAIWTCPSLAASGSATRRRSIAPQVRRDAIFLQSTRKIASEPEFCSSEFRQQMPEHGSDTMPSGTSPNDKHGYQFDLNADAFHENK